jgi:hypothetical protein
MVDMPIGHLLEGFLAGKSFLKEREQQEREKKRQALQDKLGQLNLEESLRNIERASQEWTQKQRDIQLYEEAMGQFDPEMQRILRVTGKPVRQFESGAGGMLFNPYTGQVVREPQPSMPNWTNFPGVTEEDYRNYVNKMTTRQPLASQIKEQSAWEMYQELNQLENAQQPQTYKQQVRYDYLRKKFPDKINELLRKTRSELSQGDAALLNSLGYEWKGEPVVGGVEQGVWEKKGKSNKVEILFKEEGDTTGAGTVQPVNSVQSKPEDNFIQQMRGHIIDYTKLAKDHPDWDMNYIKKQLGD